MTPPRITTIYLRLLPPNITSSPPRSCTAVLAVFFFYLFAVFFLDPPNTTSSTPRRCTAVLAVFLFLFFNFLFSVLYLRPPPSNIIVVWEVCVEWVIQIHVHKHIQKHKRIRTHKYTHTHTGSPGTSLPFLVMQCAEPSLVINLNLKWNFIKKNLELPCHF